MFNIFKEALYELYRLKSTLFKFYDSKKKNAFQQNNKIKGFYVIKIITT